MGWKVHEKLALRNVSTLNENQRLLVAFGSLRSELNNGGFSQYFFNSAGDSAPVAVAAATAMGADAVVALLLRAMAVLGDPYPVDRLRRQERQEELGDAAEDLFERVGRGLQRV